MKKKGFTLIELLVVISIIGILAGLTLSSFTAAQKQARDTTRKSDLNQYRIALETFTSVNNGKYPSRTGAASAADQLCAIDISAFMSACPEDPMKTQDGSHYHYTTSGGTGNGNINATSYILWADLETGSYYWVVCSDGRSGKVVTEPVAKSSCPL